MKVLVFTPYALLTPHFETELDLLQRHLDAGDQVEALVCNRELEVCEPNLEHRQSACLKCMGRRDAGFAALSQPIKTQSLEGYDSLDLDDEALIASLDSIDDLRACHIESLDLGYAVISSAISHARDPDVNLAEHGDLLRRYLRASLKTYRAMQRRLAADPVDLVYIFNGRFAIARSVLRACQQAGIRCMVHERGCNAQHYSLYENSTPHDHQLVYERMNAAWAAAEDNPERETIAQNWFEQRVAGVQQAWSSFVSDQRQGELPNNWDSDKCNVAIFISSEDEFASIGPSWKNPLYESQADGLRRILASLKDAPDDLHLYLRVHPNLAGVDTKQTRQLMALSAPFLTVIPSEATTSTYALIQQSDKVLSFGSTTGIEAVYWGTPSILSGVCFYCHFDAVHRPKSHEALVDLLKRDLPTPDAREAYKYGYYMATFGETFQYFSPQGLFSGAFKGKKVRPNVATRVAVELLKTGQKVNRLANLARQTIKWRKSA